MYRIQRMLAATTAVGMLAAAPAALAEFPDKNVRVIVPFPAGGATDVVARALAARLAQTWGQTVLVENRPGAGGNIGADFVAKSAPDGHTLLMASPAETTINPCLYTNLPFDPAADLTPVAKVTSAPLVLVVHSESPVNSVEQLVSHIKSSESSVNYASSGTGGPQHLAAELFKLMSDVELTHVPYKGGAPAMTDLLGQHVDLFFAGLPPALPHLRADRLRALGVTTAERSALLPEVPTIAEQGLPGFDIENWQGIFVRSGTPPEIVDRLSRDIADVVADEAFGEQLEAQGAGPAFMAPEAFEQFVQAERQKYEKLVQESGATVD